MAPDPGQGRSSTAWKRLALLAFGGLLALLFAGFAIVRGIGDPSIPAGAVAIVEGAPGELRVVTDAEFHHALVQTSANSLSGTVPKPGEPEYETVAEATLRGLFDAIWMQSQAAELGISITQQEVAKELEKLKTQTYKTKKEYEEFLKESHDTQADVETGIRTQISSGKIQERIAEGVPQPSEQEIEDYYDAARESKYTTPETRDIRVIESKDKSKVEEAKAALEKDDSVKSWEKVAKKYSTDTTRSSGGLRSGVGDGTLAEPLNEAVFAAGQGELQGPVKEAQAYVVFEVGDETPGEVKPLDEVEAQIAKLLSERATQEATTVFFRHYVDTWASRTFCAPGFAIVSHCSEFKFDIRPPEERAACFEAHPKGGPSEFCQAAVVQPKPAQPGTVSPLNPEGQRLAQRPRPSTLGPPEAEAAAP